MTCSVIDDDRVEDDLVRLMFIFCHPVLSTEARIALTLRLLGGLTTEEIARAFLVSEQAVTQRIVRAKRTLATEKIPFEVPPQAERAARLASVLVGDLLARLGRSAEAGQEFSRAAALARNAAERTVLLQRAAACASWQGCTAFCAS